MGPGEVGTPGQSELWPIWKDLPNVRAYGKEPWEPRDDDDEGPPPIALREVSLVCSFEDMRRVARFVNKVVAMIDSDDVEPMPGWHMHFRDLDADWTEDEDDLIVHWNAEE